MGMKTCKGCQEELPIERFYKNGGGQPGHRNKCKSCLAEQTNRWKACNPSKVMRYVTNYQKAHPDKAREWNNKATAKWKKQNKEKRFAGHQISNRVRDKKIIRQNCVVCKKLYGREILGQAHHCDYNKPLEVMWLCHSHHRAWHRQFLAEQVVG